MKYNTDTCTSLFVLTELLRLEEETRDWVQRHRPVNTVKAYNTYQRQFQTFCAEKMQATRNPPPVMVAAFIKDCVEKRNLSANTASKVVPAAIADEYKRGGLPNPLKHPLVKATMQTAARVGKQPVRKAPLLLKHLEEIMTHENKGNEFRLVRNQFLIMVMMGGMLRESEAVALTSDDVWVDEVTVESKSKKVLFIFIEKSKTDQERRGHTVVLGENEKNPILCPVTWFEKYVAVRNRKKKFFFHAHGTGDALAKTTPHHILKAMLEQMGVDAKKYGSHSCRRGGCTAAAAKHIQERLLMRHGNWKSSAVHDYIMEPMEDLLSVSLAIFT